MEGAINISVFLLNFELVAKVLLLSSEWSKALLLEKWMTNAVQCCEAAGIAPPASALQLVAPTPPMMTPSPPNSVITPPPPPHIPGESMEEEDLGEGSVENMVSIGWFGLLRIIAFVKVNWFHAYMFTTFHINIFDMLWLPNLSLDFFLELLRV